MAGVKRGFKLQNMGIAEMFMVFFVIVPVVVALVFGFIQMKANSWTGTGTVTNKVYVPASDGSFLNCGMLAVGGPCWWQDTSSPDSWGLTVQSDDGEHSFRATKEQYDETKVGESFTKR